MRRFQCIIGGRTCDTQTITEVQSRDILTASELTKVREFLRDADMLVSDVKSLFFNTGDFATAARLKDIKGRLADEIQAFERLIASSNQVSPLNTAWPLFRQSRSGMPQGHRRVTYATVKMSVMRRRKIRVCWPLSNGADNALLDVRTQEAKPHV